jgi:hypothetical protein
MANSRFWGRLAKMFRALQVNSRMRAEWHYIDGCGLRQWALTTASVTSRIRFIALARRGAAALSEAGGGSDPLDIWLEALLLVDRNSRLIMKRFGYEEDADGTEGAHHQTGMISRVCEASANCCDELESRAREAELRIKLQADEDRAKASEITHSSGESVGCQIDRLRKECRMTLEQLAGKVDLNIRTVQKQIADTYMPLGRNLTTYERVFSKSLDRKIVIKNTP